VSDKHVWQTLFPKFPKSQVTEALKILQASVFGLKKAHRSEREDDVTRRLRLRIRQNSLFKESNLELLCQYEVYDPQDRDPELRGRLDLSFHLLNAPKPVPYFAVEAKRLRYHTPKGMFKTGNSEYVTGNQGMRCFTEDRYAEGLDGGAMLGYVYDADVSAAEEAIVALITENKVTLKCEQNEVFESSSKQTEIAGLKQTIHQLEGRAFNLFHILVAV
jgi:hypothetical protein